MCCAFQPDPLTSRTNHSMDRLNPKKCTKLHGKNTFFSPTGFKETKNKKRGTFARSFIEAEELKRHQSDFKSNFSLQVNNYFKYVDSPIMRSQFIPSLLNSKAEKHSTICSNDNISHSKYKQKKLCYLHLEFSLSNTFLTTDWSRIIKSDNGPIPSFSLHKIGEVTTI